MFGVRCSRGQIHIWKRFVVLMTCFGEDFLFSVFKRGRDRWWKKKTPLFFIGQQNSTWKRRGPCACEHLRKKVQDVKQQQKRVEEKSFFFFLTISECVQCRPGLLGLTITLNVNALKKSPQTVLPYKPAFLGWSVDQWPFSPGTPAAEGHSPRSRSPCRGLRSAPPPRSSSPLRGTDPETPGLIRRGGSAGLLGAAGARGGQGSLSSWGASCRVLRVRAAAGRTAIPIESDYFKDRWLRRQAANDDEKKAPLPVFCFKINLLALPAFVAVTWLHLFWNRNPFMSLALPQ